MISALFVLAPYVSTLTSSSQTVKNFDKEKAALKAVEDAKKLEEDKAKEQEKLSADLTNKTRDLTAAQSKIREIEAAKAELDALVKGLK